MPLYPSVVVAYDKYRNEYNKHPKNKNSQIINVSGICTDTRDEFSLLNGNPSSASKKQVLEGEINFKFQVNKQAQINQITGNCSLAFPSGNQRDVHIEIYDLQHKTPKTQAEKNVIKSKEKEEKIKRLKEKQHKKTYRLFGKQINLGKK